MQKGRERSSTHTETHMTYPEHTQTTQNDHLERALDSARQLAAKTPVSPVSTEWMQAATQAGDLSVLALALTR
jgi:hypothetical protein